MQFTLHRSPYFFCPKTLYGSVRKRSNGKIPAEDTTPWANETGSGDDTGSARFSRASNHAEKDPASAAEVFNRAESQHNSTSLFVVFSVLW